MSFFVCKQAFFVAILWPQINVIPHYMAIRQLLLEILFMIRDKINFKM